MKKYASWKLPLNEEPSIITCIHHAYPCAIIESKELAYISINDFDKNKWNEKTTDTSICINNNTLKILEKGIGKDTNAVIWRNCKIIDEIVLHVDYVKTRDLNRYIDIFLFSDDMEEELKQKDKICGVRWNPFGYFVSKNMYCYDMDLYTYIKLGFENSKIKSYASKDGENWDLLECDEIPARYVGKQLNIGVDMYFSKYYYEIWKNMNFIQLLYNETDPYKGISLDYYFFPRKNSDNSYGCYQNFIDTHYDSLSDELDCFQTVHEFIHWNLQHLYYVNICLDEFYVVNRQYYNKSHYNHYNLFYGYDDIKRVYYIMGYGNGSKPSVSELSYDQFDYNVITSMNVVRYKYMPNVVTPIQFNIMAVINGLREYLYSIDSSTKLSNLLSEEKVFYGISNLKLLANTDIGRKKIRSDRRVSFCLLEHCRLMGERLNFLYVNNYIEKKQYEQLLPQCDDMINCSSVLMGLILKNMCKTLPDDKIDQSVLKLYDKEKVFIENLINCLDRQ